MDREAIIERAAQERWDKIISDANKRIGHKVSKPWNEIPQREKVEKKGHIEEILDTAGFFDLLEAAEEVWNEFGYTLPLSQKEKLGNAIARVKGDS